MTIPHCPHCAHPADYEHVIPCSICYVPRVWPDEATMAVVYAAAELDRQVSR